MKIVNPGPFFQGHVSLERTARGVKPWRLPHGKSDLFPSAGNSLMTRAELASGVSLRFRTDGDRVVLAFHADCEDPSFSLDLSADGEILETRRFTSRPGGEFLCEFPLKGEGEQDYGLWLPQFASVEVAYLEFPGAGFAEIPDDRRLRWLTYGSSITHCRAADSPGRTWPATAARKLDLNLTALGFGGQCHFDGMVGKVIRDREADIITLKLGINVFGGGSLNGRTYLPGVINLIHTIREKHPRTPLGIISPIFSCLRETEPNVHGIVLPYMREWDKRAVEIFRDRGDDHIFYYDGLALFGPKDADHLPDDLHPDGEGYQLMGERAADFILPELIANLV